VSARKIVIIVSGNAQNGKDTLADMLAAWMINSKRDAYAAPLKACVHLKTGIPMDILNGPASVKEDVKHGRYGQTPRKLMQDEGQEARDRISRNVWVDRAAERAKAASERVIVISDGRHPTEEISVMREQMGPENLTMAVRIVRPSEPVTRGHPSEDKIADAPDSLFDVKVINNGTLDDLKAAAQQVADLALLKAKTGKKQPDGWIVGPFEDAATERPVAGRYLEPFALLEEAEALAAKDDAPVTPVSYDRIEII
jgi:hypothetical protein